MTDVPRDYDLNGYRNKKKIAIGLGGSTPQDRLLTAQHDGDLNNQQASAKIRHSNDINTFPKDPNTPKSR
jgi:hypothetical protein